MRALKKLPVVEADMADAAEWYETHRPGLGQRFVFAVQSADKLLLANPFRYSVRFADVRRLNLAVSPAESSSFSTMARLSSWQSSTITATRAPFSKEDEGLPDFGFLAFVRGRPPSGEARLSCLVPTHQSRMPVMRQ
jgi:hypothetical protein